MSANWFKTTLLMAAIVALFGVIGGAVGGAQGMVIALLLGGAMNVFAYWNSDKMVLRMYNAQQVDEASSPYLYNMVKELAGRAGLPMPRVYIIDEAQPNAFATGRNPSHAAVAATTGLLNTLSREEAAGVMAHELAHIKHYDTLTMTITATLAGAISMLANFAMFFGGNRNNNNGFGIIGTIAMMILAPLAAMVVQMAVSRSREYEADRVGAEICGQPLWLASALGKIAGYAKAVPNMPAEHNPATAHMFIINPLSGERMDSLFSTHPATENRIAALHALAQQMGADASPGFGNGRGGPVDVPQGGPWGGAATPRGAWGRSGSAGRDGGQPGSRRGPWG